MEQRKWQAFKAHCADLIGPLQVPRPFTITNLSALVANRRGRPLRLLPLPGGDSGESGVCGMWIAFADTDHVYYSEVTSPVHQTHIILHELAHMLLDHQQTGAPQEASLERLFPDLDPSMAARLLARGRSGASDEQEQEAELMASLMWQHFDLVPAALPCASPTSSNALRRVMSTFTDAYGWGGSRASL
ncbi:hypothetical protein [Streptomyces sp. NPDC054958]